MASVAPKHLSDMAFEKNRYLASSIVRAAEVIFNHAAKAIEIEDIEARVSELERTAELAKSQNRGDQ